MWYLTRSTGIVATILVVAALVWGFFFSSRATGKRLRPAWWLDLHNWLGGIALVFTGLHIVTAWLDTSSGIGLKQIAVPGTATIDGWAITWGVLATYLLVVVVFTTWPRRLPNRRWWRILHLTSVGATVLALVHAYQSGSDATRLSFRVGFVAASALATYGLGIRVFSLEPGSKRRR
jgi:predicted ferric reductase